MSKRKFGHDKLKRKPPVSGAPMHKVDSFTEFHKMARAVAEQVADVTVISPTHIEKYMKRGIKQGMDMQDIEIVNDTIRKLYPAFKIGQPGG